MREIKTYSKRAPFHNALIQELISDGIHAVKKYEPRMDKIMRMHSVTSTIENGFVHLPDQGAWRDEYVHELTTFPNGRHDDQADSTSQALDWFKQESKTCHYAVLEYYKESTKRIRTGESSERFYPTRSDVLRRWNESRFWFRR
jgi:hypothetical protein